MLSTAAIRAQRRTSTWQTTRRRRPQAGVQKPAKAHLSYTENTWLTCSTRENWKSPIAIRETRGSRIRFGLGRAPINPAVRMSAPRVIHAPDEDGARVKLRLGSPLACNPSSLRPATASPLVCLFFCTNLGSCLNIDDILRHEDDARSVA
jgi:hypothetical protein